MLQACAVTDIGPVRKTNEDSFVSDPEVRLFAVADGMGGHDAGEVASRLAIEAISGFIQRSARDTDFSWPYGLDGKLSYDGNRLRTAIHLANRRIFRAAESNDDYSGMGTTIVGLLTSESNMAIGHVGDSRLYLIRGQRDRAVDGRRFVGGDDPRARSARQAGRPRPPSDAQRADQRPRRARAGGRASGRARSPERRRPAALQRRPARRARRRRDPADRAGASRRRGSRRASW